MHCPVFPIYFWRIPLKQRGFTAALADPNLSALARVMSTQQALALPSPAASNTVVINARCSLRIRSGSARDRRGWTARCITIAPGMRFAEPALRWCSWWSRALPSKRTWLGRLTDRCAPCGAAKRAMCRAGWRRSVAEKAGVAVGVRISRQRLRSIELLKSQGMRCSAVAAPAGGEREGDSQAGRTRRFRRPAESAQLAFAGMTTAAAGPPAAVADAVCGEVVTVMRMAPRRW